MAGTPRAARRIAVVSMGVSGLLALAKLWIGLLAGSASVVADGFESAGDVVAAGIAFFGLAVAARPPDERHPYGHGRFETVTALGVGIMLAVVGAGISYRSLAGLSEVKAPPAAYALWPLVASIVLKGALSPVKFHIGKKARSSVLVADSWNDAVDVLSGMTALAGVGLAVYDPGRFLQADRYGGFAVGLIVIFLGLRVVRDTTLQLMDTMPDPVMMDDIRRVATSIEGVMGVEKCFARSTGLMHHVDLHLEVDPNLTVRASHDIARQVREKVIQELDWVADVLVHVEPYPPLLS